jgi:hypothetical protein
MVVIVAVLLAVTSLSLQERQGENILNEKRQQIVKALGENPATASYSDVVAEAAMLDKNGQKIEGKTDADIFSALGDLTASEREMARNALRSEIAWQIIVGRTVLPTVSISADDIATERAGLAREHGLPIEMTLVRLTDIPADVANKLTAPKSCEGALEMARALGGEPQKFIALQYELSPEIRNRVAALPLLTWSAREDDSVLLVCSTKKTSEYKNLDDIIKQNATYKQAMFLADQQLKQLRRKAVIVINDDRYKL